MLLFQVCQKYVNQNCINMDARTSQFHLQERFNNNAPWSETNTFEWLLKCHLQYVFKANATVPWKVYDLWPLLASEAYGFSSRRENPIANPGLSDRHATGCYLLLFTFTGSFKANQILLFPSQRNSMPNKSKNLSGSHPTIRHSQIYRKHFLDPTGNTDASPKIYAGQCVCECTCVCVCVCVCVLH